MKIKKGIIESIGIFEFMIGAAGICIALFWIMIFVSLMGGIFLLIFGAVYMYAGHLLLNRKKRGYRLSLLLQTLSLPCINSKLFAYKFIYLFSLYGLVYRSHGTSKFGVGLLFSLFQMSFHWGGHSTLNGVPFLGVNIIALFIIVFLVVNKYRLIEEYKQETSAEFLLL